MACKRGVRFFDSKKGMDIELMFNVFELFVVFMAASILYYFINSEADSSNFEKQYFARDSALMLNTMYASQGDIEYGYYEKADSFIFDFKPNKAEVYHENEPKESGVISYPFAEDKNYNFVYKTLRMPTKITFEKKKNNIEVFGIAKLPPREGDFGGGGASGEWKK